MALTRLNPPIIAGTIPSFYSTNIGTSLEVPFSMNTTVSLSAVAGIKLRFKSSATDIVLANIYSSTYSDKIAEFDLNSIKDKLIVGNFYKVQLAYVGNDGVEGYYSTVSVVKYTAQPKIQIAGLNAQVQTTISGLTLTGVYTNTDSSEKVYQYRFRLYSPSDDIIQDTGWQIHNIQSDTSLTQSNQLFNIAVNLNEDEVYKVDYSIITNYGIEITTARYDIIQSVYLGQTLKDIKIESSLDYDNARVKVALLPVDEAISLKGYYVICRKKADDVRWEQMFARNLETTIYRNKPYIYYDYMIEDGEKYDYSLQKVNLNGIFSQRILTPVTVRANFEDAFLYDGARQLRIRFNPNVSSFKPVIGETIKTTLGRKYPFILRNGVSNYKEFPISGLLSYQADNDELFIKNSDLDKTWEGALTDLVDENFVAERRFKLEALQWLTNGKTKLFKSPQEGNYIVQLTKVSLSPQQTLSRMLHTFSCTATEIAPFSIDALVQNTEEPEELVVESKIIEIDLRADKYTSMTQEQLKNYDILEGKKCKSLKYRWYNEIYDLSTRQDVIGMTFEWAGYNFAVGPSGTIDVEMDDFIEGQLHIVSAPILKGKLILEVAVEQQEDELEKIDSVQMIPLAGYSFFGPDVCNLNESLSFNLLKDFSGKKLQLVNAKYFAYYTVSLLVLYNYTEAEIKAYLGDRNYENWNNNIIVQQLLDDGSRYYYYTGGDIVLMPNYNTNILFGTELVDIAKLSEGGNYHTIIPYDKEGNPCLKIGPGVYAQLYVIEAVNTYTAELDNVRYTNLELENYRDYVMKRFNLEPVSDKIYNPGKSYFYFENRIFVPIPADEVEDYLTKTSIQIYRSRGVDNIYPESEIEAAKRAHEGALEALNNWLEQEV